MQSKGSPQPAPQSDKDGIIADPQLVLPLLEYVLNYNIDDFQSFPFFKMAKGSVCSEKGNLILSNGGKDFWGKTVAADSKPNIGADGEMME